MTQPVIRIDHDVLSVHLAFSDVRISDMDVHRWSDERVAQYRKDYDRWNRLTIPRRALFRMMAALRRSPFGDGLVQRSARRIKFPLSPPSSSSTRLENISVWDGRPAIALGGRP